jgi:hypothetical protein
MEIKRILEKNCNMDQSKEIHKDQNTLEKLSNSEIHKDQNTSEKLSNSENQKIETTQKENAKVDANIYDLDLDIQESSGPMKRCSISTTCASCSCTCSCATCGNSCPWCN